MKEKYKIWSSITLYSSLFLLLFPFINMCLWTFTKRWEWPYLLPQSYGMRGIIHILDRGGDTLKVLGTSILLSSIVTVMTLLITIPGAKALTLYPIRGKEFWTFLIWAPLIVPMNAIGMGIHMAFIQVGLADTILGVVIVQLVPCIPYAMLILQDVFIIIGDRLEQQAKVLGASPLQTVWHVTLPVLAPAIVSAGSIVFIMSFSQYFLTFLIGGGKIITLPMVMFPYIQNGDRMLSAIYSFIFIGTIFIFLGTLEKVIGRHYKAQGHFYR